MLQSEPASKGDDVIAHGLSGRSDLNGLRGRVTDVHEDRGRCAVHFSSGETVSIKHGNLLVESVYDDMLTVAGKNYCAAHRLEVCGECSYNFRMGNRLQDLAWDPNAANSGKVYAKAKALDAQEAEQNLPAMLAPGSPARPPEASLRASQLVPSSLDPDVLKTWDHDGTWPIIEAPFLLSFSMAEMGAMKQGRHHGDPEFELRQTLQVIARACDDCCADPAQLSELALKSGRSRKDAMPRPTKARVPIPSFTIQDSAQSEAIMLHVVRVLDSDRQLAADSCRPCSYSMTSPVIEVRYTYNTAAGLSADVIKSIEAAMRLLPPKTLQKPIGAEVAEIRLLLKMLLANRARLKPDFVHRASKGLPHGWHTSVLMPLLKKSATEKKLCQCGKAVTKFCSRCLKQGYCSAACQKTHWPTHKLCCRKPDKAPGSLATVSIAAAENDARLDETMARMQGINLSHTSLQNSTATSRNAYAVFAGADDDATRGAMIPFKLQVPMAPNEVDAAGVTASTRYKEQTPAVVQDLGDSFGGGDPRGVAIMAYDQRRRLQFKIYPSACAQHAELLRTIRTRGMCGGLKAYFNAYLTSQRELKIVMDELLPAQPW